ncbi:glycosyltransferase family 2 protein [Candidatus Albibeggiatoa sp. nov. NOAA]|uniref:glycosyltransferase family 2 protein n=1 Tax=Candidatus Albibeggiatoa sp. nov. NOAA TaxID=3162724 RepID=UPI0032F8A9B3|nr:glycosyltransferase family 2 protein [Thiotrichaceae bacterium]
MQQLVKQAMVLAKQGRVQDAILCYQKAIKANPNQPVQVYQALGELLLQAGQLNAAEDCFQFLVSNISNYIDGYVNLAKIAMQANKLTIALERWEYCIQTFPDKVQLIWLVNKADILLKLERFEESEHTFQLVIKIAPKVPAGYIGLAQVAQMQYQWLQVTQYWDICLQRFQNQAQPNWYLNCATAHNNIGQFQQSTNVLTQATEQFPDNLKLFIELAKTYEKWMKFDIAIKQWENTLQLFPNEIEIQIGHIACLSQATKYAEAEQHCHDFYQKTQNIQFLTVLSDNLVYQYQYDEALKIISDLIAAHPENTIFLLKKAHILMAYREQDKFQLAVDVLQSFNKKHPNAKQTQLFLANAYIHNNEFDAACQIISNLDIKNSKSFLELKAWYHHINNNEQQAKLVYEQIFKQYYSPRIHAKFSLKRIDTKPINPQSNEIFLFTRVKNEADYFEWFLNYYRNLGVSRFFIVDNDSSDQTQQILLNQPDVHVFWTDDHYGLTGSGVRWINELVERYGTDHWCLFIDTDEALVFPDMEQKNLTHLVSYMDEHQYDAMNSFMLDMYSESSSQEAYQAGDDLVKYASYFDSRHDMMPTYQCGYRLVSGGMRKRLFGERETLNKTPLIKGGKGIKFLSSCHYISPARIADVSSVLLHYKIALAPNSKLETPILETEKVKNMASHCKRRNHRYHQILSQLDDETYLCADSVKYESSQQLVDLGLMHRPKNF